MSTEHSYHHDSEPDPSRYTDAERSFFRWQYTLGSYEYLREHGSPGDAKALSQELTQRYEQYRALRDHPGTLYTAGERPASTGQRPALFVRERLPFGLIRVVQEELERRGYYFLPVEREHTEGPVTGPLVHRLKTHIKKRGFARVAGRALITFSGYEDDPREVYEIPEIRAYYHQLDIDLPELPALLAYLPDLGFNGPGMYLMLLGEVDQAIHRPERGGYDVHVVNAEPLIQQALARIQQASTRYHLGHNDRERLQAAFLAGATYRFP
jgi:hypothetical protein